jgi:hypothetical protein
MNIKATLISILLVLLASCDKMEITTSQADSFIKFYNTYPVFRGADVKEIPGKGFAVIGTVKSYTSGDQICLIRTDIYGNSIDSARYYGSSSDDEAFCLQVLEDHGLAILGSSTNPETGKKQVLFIKTDSVGNVEWSKLIGSSVNTVAYHFEISQSGSYIMAGYTESVKSLGLNKDIWLFGLDKEGNNIENWSSPRLIGGIYDDESSYLQLLGNGDIVLTGKTKSYPSTTYDHAYVIITNPIGGVKSFCWIESARDEEGRCIRILDESSFVIIGTSNYASSGNGTDIMFKKVTISAQSQEINWEKTFPSPGNDYGNSLIIKDNSLYMLVTTASTGTNTSIGLIETDLDGNDPYAVYFGNGTELSGNAFGITTDQGFIITGTNKHSDNDMSMALIKLKPDGTL